MKARSFLCNVMVFLVYAFSILTSLNPLLPGCIRIFSTVFSLALRACRFVATKQRSVFAPSGATLGRFYRYRTMQGTRLSAGWVTATRHKSRLALFYKAVGPKGHDLLYPEILGYVTAGLGRF